MAPSIRHVFTLFSGLALLASGCSASKSDTIDPSDRDTGGEPVCDPYGCDSGNAVDSGQVDPGLPDYCADALPVAICDPAVHLDNIWDYSGDIPLETVAGRVLSLPFTTRDSEVDGGQLSVKTVEGVFTDGTAFRMWFSERAGGPPLSTETDCIGYFAQARGGIYWTQNPELDDNDGFCHFGQSARVLYLNFDVCVTDELGDCAGPRVGDYNFDLRRDYKAY